MTGSGFGYLIIYLSSPLVIYLVSFKKASPYFVSDESTKKGNACTFLLIFYLYLYKVAG